MYEDNEPVMTFTYRGYGRDLIFRLDDDEADFLPHVMDAFAEFLRAASFVYVGVYEEDGKYIFHKDYNWREASPRDTADPIDQVNKAAEDYWDKLMGVERPVSMPSSVRDTVDLPIGSTVLYNAQGAPDKDAKHPHAGNSGVSLKHMRGQIVAYNANPLPRYLVRWDHWHDGHNGMGADPDAKVGASNYWWVGPDNLTWVS